MKHAVSLMMARCHFERRYQSRIAGAVDCAAFPFVSEGRQMKNALPRNQAEQSAPSKRQFTGTDNPRHLRAITALMRRPISRQELDSVAGASNSPELVAELRRRGLEVPCERIRFIDRDGCPCRPGVYSFTTSDRRKFYQWQADSMKGRAQ